ncbi:MAG TPA: FAD-dependent oxidoreductase [Polyangiales bacterium]|nr:FAD-dependent oxidoreductase [Polyangiales bacterium]
MRVLVIGAGLAGLAAAERLLDVGVKVVVVDAFPRPGGRVANFDVSVPVAGLIPGDIVEHGLHAWFQHYRALFGLMERAGVEKPPFAGTGVHVFDPQHGHLNIPGGPFLWLLNAMRLPHELRGERSAALRAFGRLIKLLDGALADPTATDRESAAALFARMGVPPQAARSVFGPCLYSLTSLALDQLSALEMLRWMAAVLPDPRIRCLEGGGSTAMCDPIVRYLRARGADLRFGVEVERLSLGAGRRVRVELVRAPDKTGLRHVLVPGFQPDEPPDADSFDAIVCTLPWERLLAVSAHDPALRELSAWQNMQRLRNVHPLTMRIWFERPIEGADEHYILSRGTLFDVLRPTRERERYAGVRLIDCLVEDIDTHLPEIGYEREHYLAPGSVQTGILERVLADLERMYPGQIRDNRVLRTFFHTREGIVACKPGVWQLRAPADVGIENFRLAGDWTQHGWGVCMEGAVRSGQLAVDTLVSRDARKVRPPTYEHLVHSLITVFHRQ